MKNKNLFLICINRRHSTRGARVEHERQGEESSWYECRIINSADPPISMLLGRAQEYQQQGKMLVRQSRGTLLRSYQQHGRFQIGKLIRRVSLSPLLLFSSFRFALGHVFSLVSPTGSFCLLQESNPGLSLRDSTAFIT